MELDPKFTTEPPQDPSPPASLKMRRLAMTSLMLRNPKGWKECICTLHDGAPQLQVGL